MEAIDALTQRVSGSDLIEPAPDDLDLHSILSAAVRAPDHGRLRPWRFTVLRGGARERLGALLAQAYRRRHPDATSAQIDKETNRPLRAPLVVVVGAKVNHACNIPAIEQILSAGAAAQNIMIAAFALGYGCAWKTGEAAYDAEIKAAFGLEATDAIVGFLYLGTNAKPLSPAIPVDIGNHLAEWPEDG